MIFLLADDLTKTTTPSQWNYNAITRVISLQALNDPQTAGDRAL
jgi:hypothetical protein